MSDTSPLEPVILTREEYEAKREQAELALMDSTLRSLATKPRPYPIPRAVGRKKVEQAFHTAFEIIGGVPRFALWADSNPTEFYKLYARLLPQEMTNKMEGGVTIQHVLPRTSLDD